MTSRDPLDFEVNVNGAKGRAELDKVLKKIRDLGVEATKTGNTIDKETVDAVQGYGKVAKAISAAVQEEERLERSVQATRAARARAVQASANARAAQTGAGTAVQQNRFVTSKADGQEQKNRTAALEAENRLLIQQGTIALTNDRRADQARTAEMRAHNMELAAQAKIAAAEEARNTKYANYQRQSLARIEKQEQADLARISKVSRAEYAAQQKAAAAALANDQNNTYNDYLAHQKDNAPSVAQLSATRYALYDVAQNAAIAGLAVGAIGGYAIYSASKFEYAFSGVQRAAELTGSQIGDVRGQLVELSESVPTNFEDIANIAQLGAQMNIAGDDLDDFSGTVSRFAATTNSSIDTTAQSFGRLSNLLDVPASKFENLGSAIAKVGVKSVATETEILSTTTQIAGAAAVYGFTADEVVGLGAAFASLAIAPEAARGSVTRLFGDIEKATADGADGLKEYARIMGTDVKTALQLWKDDPSAFFSKLVAGLSKSKSLIQDITAIGANDVRDQNLLQRLAGSPEVLQQTLQVSKDAFTEGTYLADAYAIQTDNLQSKLLILANNFNSLAASAGGPLNEALKAGVDLLTYFVRIVGDAPPALLAIIAAVALIVGGFLLFKAATAGAMAVLLTLQAVFKNLDTQVTLTGINLRSLNATLATTRAMMAGGATSAATFSSGMNTAKTAAIGFGKSTLALAAVAFLFEGISEAASRISYTMSSASQKAEDYFGSFGGLKDAMDADTKALENGHAAIATFTGELPGLSEGQDGSAEAAANLASVLGTAGDAATDAAGKTKVASVAFGDASKEFLRAQLQASPAFQEATKSNAFVKYFQDIGADIDTALDIAAKDGEQGVKDYFAKLQAAAAASGKIDISSALATSVGEGGTSPADYTNKLADALSGVSDQAQQVANSSAIMGGSIGDAGADIAGAGDDAEGAANQVSALKDVVDNLFSGITSEGDFYSSLNGLYSALYESGNVFNTFTESGRAAFDSLQDSIVSTINFAGTMGISAQDALLPLFLSLQQQGVDTTALLQQLAASPIMYTADIDISALLSKLNAIGAGGAGTPKLTKNQTALNNAMNKSATSANNAAKAIGKVAGGGGGSAAKKAEAEIVTLTDYVKDLTGVMNNAFDIRFGTTKALDDITSKWNDIADANKEANDNIREYLKDIQDLRREIDSLNADIMGLNSDRGILEYQYGVAVNYGDTLRANAIQAELAQNAADLADKNAKLGDVNEEIANKQRLASDAAAVLSRSLVGNSDAAIGNRADLMGLVKSYTDYVGQLANTGLSQDELSARTQQLRAEFIQQATQLGYNTNDVLFYAASFDDLTYSINNVPRNITVAANTNPAQRALEEFLARVNASSASPTINGGGAYQSGVAAGENWTNGFEDATVASFDMSVFGRQQGGSSDVFSKIADAAGTLRLRATRSGGFARGGFVPGDTPSNALYDNARGNLPGGDSVNLQGGEPISTNAARSFYGDKMFEDINALKYKPQVTMPTVVVQQSATAVTGGYTRLSPEDRQLLQDIKNNIGLKLSGPAVQQIASSGDLNNARLGRS